MRTFRYMRPTMNAALVVFRGCLQMIKVLKTRLSMMIETQSKLHHSRACRESAD